MATSSARTFIFLAKACDFSERRSMGIVTSRRPPKVAMVTFASVAATKRPFNGFPSELVQTCSAARFSSPSGFVASTVRVVGEGVGLGFGFAASRPWGVFRSDRRTPRAAVRSTPSANFSKLQKFCEFNWRSCLHRTSGKEKPTPPISKTKQKLTKSRKLKQREEVKKANQRKLARGEKN